MIWTRSLRWTCALVASSAAVFACAAGALADKLHLKDGRVLEGTVIRQGDGFVYFRVTVAGVPQDQLFTSDAIEKVEKTDTAPAVGGGDAGAKPESESKVDGASEAGKDAATTGEADAAAAVITKPGVSRIAVLNFGPPSAWKGEVESMVGGVIQAKFWDQAIAMLKKDKVDIVVVRVNSGGGALLELERFHKVFEEKYKPNFRVVAWIESAISAAAMSPWVIEELYFMPDGNMGACTGFSGRLNAIKGMQLEQVLIQMEKAGERGRRPSPFIMRAMQIQEPLSVDVDEDGNVIWRQDEAGQTVLNRANRVFTINATDAVKFKFARGIASNLDELAKAMKLPEWELAGKAASEFIDRTMRDADAADKRFVTVVIKYQREMQFAQGQQDRARRGEFLGLAKKSLSEIKRLYKENWLTSVSQGIDDEWIKNQEQAIRDLAAP